MTTLLNNALTSKNYTLVQPFTQAVNQYGNVVYTGTMKDGEDKLVPYVHNLTVELTTNRNDSITRYNAYIAEALNKGYVHSYNITGTWVGNIGSGATPNSRATVKIIESHTTIAWYDVFTSVSVSNKYSVTSEYATKV